MYGVGVPADSGIPTPLAGQSPPGVGVAFLRNRPASRSNNSKRAKLRPISLKEGGQRSVYSTIFTLCPQHRQTLSPFALLPRQQRVLENASAHSSVGIIIMVIKTGYSSNERKRKEKHIKRAHTIVLMG